MWKTRERCALALVLVLVLVLALALIAPLIAIPGTAVGATADGPRATAVDGTVQTIDAINPSSRAAGLFALYTPSFGSSTKTNEYGGEAVLRKAGTAGAYQVVSVCTALTTCPKPGDNDIPADGACCRTHLGAPPTSGYPCVTICTPGTCSSWPA